MQIDCDLIRDLLPLYADNTCSPECRQLVEEHIKSCDDCRQRLEYMQKKIANPDTFSYSDRTADILQTEKKNSVNKKTVYICAAAVVILLAACIFISKYIFLEHYKKIAAYTVPVNQIDVSQTDKSQSLYKCSFNGLSLTLPAGAKEYKKDSEKIIFTKSDTASITLVYPLHFTFNEFFEAQTGKTDTDVARYSSDTYADDYIGFESYVIGNDTDFNYTNAFSPLKKYIRAVNLYELKAALYENGLKECYEFEDEEYSAFIKYTEDPGTGKTCFRVFFTSSDNKVQGELIFESINNDFSVNDIAATMESIR
jgi:hypothetical protein